MEYMKTQKYKIKSAYIIVFTIYYLDHTVELQTYKRGVAG